MKYLLVFLLLSCANNPTDMAPSIHDKKQTYEIDFSDSNYQQMCTSDCPMPWDSVEPQKSEPEYMPKPVIMKSKSSRISKSSKGSKSKKKLKLKKY